MKNKVKRWCRDRSDWRHLKFPWLALMVGPITLLLLVYSAVWAHTGSSYLTDEDVVV